MSRWNEILLTCMRELRRGLRSTRGLILFALIVMGGGAALYFGIAAVLPFEAAGSRLMQDSTKIFDDLSVRDYLKSTSSVFFALNRVMVFVLPLFAVLIGADNITVEIQNRTFRYRTVRARRSSLVLGHMAALVIIVAMTAAIVHLLAWMIYLMQGGSLAPVTVMTRMMVAEIIFTMAYVATISFVSVLSATTAFSLMLSLLACIVVWGFRLWSKYNFESMSYLFPGTWEQLMLSDNMGTVLGAAAACSAWTAVMTALTLRAIERRDI